MSRIGRIYAAASSATHDRYFIMKASRKNNLNKIEQNLKVYVEETSGPSTINPIEAIKRWGKAYKAGSKRLKENEAINNLFKKPSAMSQIIDYVAGVLKK